VTSPNERDSRFVAETGTIVKEKVTAVTLQKRAVPCVASKRLYVCRKFLDRGTGYTWAANREAVGMKIKVVVHEAEEGGFWAEVPAIPGCATQGETMDELMRNLHEAIEGCLAVDVAPPKPGGKERILEIAV
jgi:predicted RNase H-like HicB family nuclease